jgi:hypothetical protein
MHENTHTLNEQINSLITRQITTFKKDGALSQPELQQFHEGCEEIRALCVKLDALKARSLVLDPAH